MTIFSPGHHLSVTFFRKLFSTEKNAPKFGTTNLKPYMNKENTTSLEKLLDCSCDNSNCSENEYENLFENIDTVNQGDNNLNVKDDSVCSPEKIRPSPFALVHDSDCPSKKQKVNNELLLLKETYEVNTHSNRRLSCSCWGFFTRFSADLDVFWCNQCYHEAPMLNISTGIFRKLIGNTSVFRNHVRQMHPNLSRKFEMYCANRKQMNSELRSECVEPPFAFSEHLEDTTPRSEKTMQQLVYEQRLCVVASHWYFPLSVFDSRMFSVVTSTTYDGVQHVDSSTLVTKLIPNLERQLRCIVRSTLKNVLTCCVSYDLWITRDKHNYYCVNLHYISSNWIAKHVHLGIPKTKIGTKAKGLTLAIKRCLDDFKVKTNVIGYICNKKVDCNESLDEHISNMDIFGDRRNFPTLRVPCMAYTLQEACRTALLNSRDGDVNIQETISACENCINWMKRNPWDAGLFFDSQRKMGLATSELLAFVKTRFAYLLQSFQYMLLNRKAFDHLYQSIDDPKAKARQLSWQHWEVINMIVNTIESIICTNRYNTKEAASSQFLSDGAASFVNIYALAQQNELDANLHSQFESIKDQHGRDDHQILSFIESLSKVSKDIQTQVANSIKPIIAPLLTFKEDESQIALAMLLDPRYCNGSVIKKLHQVEPFKDFDSAVEVGLHYFDYLVKLIREHALQQFQDLSTTESSTLRSSMTSIILLEVSNYRSAALSTPNISSINPLEWWKDHEVQFPNVSKLARMILAIPPSQVENELDFSIDGVLDRAQNYCIDMDHLSRFTFISKNFRIPNLASENFRLQISKVFNPNYYDIFDPEPKHTTNSTFEPYNSSHIDIPKFDTFDLTKNRWNLFNTSRVIDSDTMIRIENYLRSTKELPQQFLTHP